MPELTVSSDSCNSLCLTGNTNNNTIRTNDFLYRRKRHFDLECGNELFMVDRSDYTEY